jgi:predicted dehydrogenase
MHDLKVAIVGAGTAARLHLLAYQKCPGARVIALCGTNADRVRAFETEFGVRGYLSVEEMLATERPDVVSVTTLEWQHEMPVLLSLAAGCHVLCEKLMAHSLAVGETMVRAAERAGRMLGVNYNYRSVPSHALIKQSLLLGELGEPAAFSANVHSYLWAHMIDLMRHFFGDPVSVSAAMADDQERRPIVTTNAGKAWDQTAEMIYHPSTALSAAFRYRNPDFVATLSGSAFAPIAHYYWSFALFGTADGLTVSGAHRDNLGGRPELGSISERLKELPAFSYPESFERSIAAFVDAVLRGEPAPVSGADGLAAMRLDAAVATSAREGRCVAL